MKNKGQFKKGNKPWNKGKKGIHLNRDTEFKKGQFTMENHPSWTDGTQRMSKDCFYISTATNKRERRPKMIYESHYGKLPKGMVIYHKDGNCHNDDIENLEAITRAELIQRNLPTRN